MSSKISILMAVYNAAPYLRESIESIRRQTLKEWELIAIDDASTDDRARFSPTMPRPTRASV